jgi:hypothetical protein
MGGMLTAVFDVAVGPLMAVSSFLHARSIDIRRIAPNAMLTVVKVGARYLSALGKGSEVEFVIFCSATFLIGRRRGSVWRILAWILA